MNHHVFSRVDATMPSEKGIHRMEGMGFFIKATARTPRFIVTLWMAIMFFGEVPEIFGSECFQRIDRWPPGPPSILKFTETLALWTSGIT